MAQQPVNHGTTAGDGTGETLFSAFTKLNANDTELYATQAAHDTAIATAQSTADSKTTSAQAAAAAGWIVPTTNDSAGITAAIAAAVAQNVWAVRLDAVDYIIDQDITLVDNIALIGVPPHLTYSGNVPDSSVNVAGGTRFMVSAGVTALKFNNVDEAVILPPAENSITGIHLHGITFSGGASHIDLGGYQAMGPVFSRFSELYSFNTTALAFNFENFQHCIFRNLYQIQRTLGVPGGGIRFANSLDSSLLPGNSTFEGEIYTYTNLREARSIVFEAAGGNGCQFNQLHVSGRLQANRYGGAPVAVTVTTTSGSGNMGVDTATNYTYLQVGVPVIFTGAAPGGFAANTVYFVSGRPAANTITLALEPSTPYAKPASTTGSYSLSTNGYAGLEIICNSTSLFTNCDFGNADLETSQNVAALVLRRTRQSKLHVSELMQSSFDTAICGRDAQLDITCGYMTNVSTDIDAASGVNFRHWHSGIRTITVNTTLVNGFHNTNTNHNSATAGTITVPAGLITGFDASFTQIGAGKVTFGAGTGVTISSLGSLFSTGGPGATVYLRSTAKNVYVLSGDLAV